MKENISDTILVAFRTSPKPRSKIRYILVWWKLKSQKKDSVEFQQAPVLPDWQPQPSRLYLDKIRKVYAEIRLSASANVLKK